MAEIVRRIKLEDGTLHESKRSAEVHLVRTLNGQQFSELYRKLGLGNSLDAREILKENVSILRKFYELIGELKELNNLEF